MATEKNPSIYDDRSSIGSSEELDEYGVWIKSGPQDISGDNAFDTADDDDESLDFSDDIFIPDSEELLDFVENDGTVAFNEEYAGLAGSESSEDASPESISFDIPEEDGAGDISEISFEETENTGDEAESSGLDISFDDFTGSPEAGNDLGITAEKTDLSEDFALDIPFEDETSDFDLSVVEPSEEPVESVVVDFGAGESPGQEDSAGEKKTATTADSQLSTQLLLQIANELSSIKSELSNLKQELSLVKGEISSHEEASGNGFFDETDDEKIALTGAEMDNILNTASFTKETGIEETEEEPVLDAASLEFLSGEGDAEGPKVPAPPAQEGSGEELEPIAIEIDMSEFGEEPVITPFEEEQLSSLPDELPEDLTQSLGLDISLDDSADISPDLSQETEDDSFAQIIPEGFEALDDDLAPPQEDVMDDEALFGEGALDALTGGATAVDDESIDLTAELTAEIETEPDELPEISLDLEEIPQEDAALDISLDTEPALDTDTVLDDGISLDAELSLDTDTFAAVNTDDSLDAELSLDLDMDTGEELPEETVDESMELEISSEPFEEFNPQALDTPELSSPEEVSADLSVEEDSVDEDITASLADFDIPETAETADLGADTDINADISGNDDELNLMATDFSGDFTIEEDDIPMDIPGPREEPGSASVEPALITPPKAEETIPKDSIVQVPPKIREELKTVLSYMDQLLESLPEEKIEEFAKSEHFNTYKKLFEDLGLV
ncbi:MAG: hypothetical protein LBT16_13915 [Treponema sp.]|jgi:hypothetical protein|nr:hypothetical protein [Treponema sp.]